MRKTAISLLAIIAILLLSPYLIGLYLRHHIQQEIIPELNTPLQSAHLVSYQQGWFSSSMHIRLQPSKDSDTDGAIDIHGSIQHGPLAYNFAKTQLALASIAFDIQVSPKSSLRRYLGTNSLLTIDGQSTGLMTISLFKQDLHITLHTVPVHFQQGPSLLEWPGLQLDMHFSRDFKQQRASVISEPLQIKSPHLNLTVGKTTFRSKTKQNQQNLWVGDSELQIATIKWQVDKGQENFISKQRLLQTSKEHQQKLQLELDAHIDAAHIEEYQAKASDLKIVLYDIDAQSIANLQKQLNQLQAQTLKGNKPAPKFITDVQTAVAKLFSRGLQLKLNSHIALAEGEVDLDKQLAIQPFTPSQHLNRDLLDAAQLKINLQAPVSLFLRILEQYYYLGMQRYAEHHKKEFNPAGAHSQAKNIAQAQLNQWLTQRYLSLDANRYALAIDYQHNQLRIGDKLVMKNK